MTDARKRYRRLIAVGVVVAVALGSVIGLRRTDDRSPFRRHPVARTAPREGSLSQQRHRVASLLQGEVAAGASTVEIRGLLEQLAATDPEFALQLAGTLARGNDEKYQWVTALLRNWTKDNPHRALDWAVANYPREIRGHPSTVGDVMNEIAAGDPQTMIREAEALLRRSNTLQGTDATELANFAIGALVEARRGDLARQLAENWAHGTNAGFVDGTTFQRVADDLARTSPMAAANWLYHLPESPGRDYALGVFGSLWAATAPSDALNWIDSLADATRRADAMVTVFRHWAERDPVGATEWLEIHESNPVGDRMITAMVESAPALRSAPELAAKWVELISDPAQRLLSLQRLVVNWQTRDRTAAQHYVETTPSLSPDERRQLARVLDGPGRSAVTAATVSDVLFFK